MTSSLVSTAKRWYWVLKKDYVALLPILLAMLVNIVVWVIALLAMTHRSNLMGTAVLSYTYGLRHALDADHISAIVINHTQRESVYLTCLG